MTVILTLFNLESTLSVSSIVMAHLFENKKFGPVKNFKRVERFNYKKNFFNIYVDKNDSVWDIRDCEVKSWKIVKKGKFKKKVPDEIAETRNLYFFERIKGNPFKIAIDKIVAEIDYKLSNNE